MGHNGKISIFISHSTKDIEKVRKIRDLFELINCEPLLFRFNCLDDDNDELEDFIKREIDARNIFLYCRSRNSESSIWVKKELEYIHSTDKKRVYTIDIEDNLESDVLEILKKIGEIILKNTVFIIFSDNNKEFGKKLKDQLETRGYVVHIREVHDSGIIPMKDMRADEYVRIHDQLSGYFETAIFPMVEEVSSKGIIITLLDNLHEGGWNSFMMMKLQKFLDTRPHALLLPVNSYDENEIPKLIDRVVNMTL